MGKDFGLITFLVNNYTSTRVLIKNGDKTMHTYGKFYNFIVKILQILYV